MQKISPLPHALALVLLGALANPVAQAAPSTDACLSPATWTALEQKPPHPIPAADLLSGMARREVVLLGESHDEDDHHRWQVHTLAALHMLRPDMVIGFEMFPRRVQPVLDKWVAGELTLKQFLARSEWDKVWNVPAELYVPLFQFARINRVPMVALNVDNALNKAVRANGWDKVPDVQREGVGRAAAPSADYLDFLFEVYRAHPPRRGAKDARSPSKTDGDFLRFVESQTTWDRAMAEALAGAMTRGARADGTAGAPLVVGIMGSGHVRHGFGVPHQLRDLGVEDVGTLLAMPASADCKMAAAGLADAVFALPVQAHEQPAPPPPRLGVQLEEKEGSVRIAEVGGGSLAKKNGLKAGDRVLEIGGTKVVGYAQVVAMVRRQPPGTWLPVRVQRGGETLNLVIKFPVAP